MPAATAASVEATGIGGVVPTSAPPAATAVPSAGELPAAAAGAADVALLERLVFFTLRRAKLLLPLLLNAGLLLPARLPPALALAPPTLASGHDPRAKDRRLLLLVRPRVLAAPPATAALLVHVGRGRAVAHATRRSRRHPPARQGREASPQLRRGLETQLANPRCQDGLLLLDPRQPVGPVARVDERIRVAHHHQPTPGPREHHVEPPRVGHEAEVAGAVAPHGRE
eukprot:scaffold33544_cov105-Isochrysis_galbana.AAC.1